MTKQREDAANLAEALDVIRGRITEAQAADFATGDQNLHGFRLTDVTYGDGLSARESLDLAVWQDVQDQVDDLVGGIEWDGVMHEDKQGYTTFDL